MSETLLIPVASPLTRAQRTQVLSLVRRAARAEILPRFRQLGAHQIDRKTGPQDLVTEADRAAEAMITRGLQAMFPHALIVGEEHASAHPEILDQIADADICITIDPVDGTWNYANGLALFGVMLSVLCFGRPVMGLLYDPVMDDWIWADAETETRFQSGRGLFRPVRTATGGAIENLVGSVPLYLVPEHHRDKTAATLTRFQRAIMIRCACHEFRMLAQGQIDFVLASKLTAWDHPGGVLTTRQAGGHVSMLDGSEYNASLRSGYLLAASTAQTWERVRDVFAFLLDGD